MAVTEYTTKRMMDTAKTYFITAYLIRGTTANYIDTAFGAWSAFVVDGAKTLSWASAVFNAGVTSITTTNSATSNPLNYSVPQGAAVLNRLYLVDSGGFPRGIITLVSPPSYSGGDGAYYVRGVAIQMTEV
jgi:hypothetical protein